MTRRTHGMGLVILASLIGLLVAYRDYITPSTGIDHSAGVVLVIISSALMLGAGIAVAFVGRGLLAGILGFLILLDIAGTSTAAWFLESPLLMAAMALAAIGWVMRTVTSAAGAPL
jgi:hypothetical protein